MKKCFFFFYFLFFISYMSFSQNVGIGTTTPHTSAALEVQSASKGMLVPRIALTAANISSPVSSPADALLIYNTATAGSGNNTVSPGFYYWSISVSRWTAISGAATNNGNMGFGVWGDCSTNGNISEYNPLADNTGAANDNFGYNVSISGNYAIVGSLLDDVGTNTDQGSASIYQYNGGNWVLMQKITDATGSANDRFGARVAISGSYAIVGAPVDDVGANVDQGSASIYQYNGSAWVLMNKITDATGTAGDYFGFSVSISGIYAIAGAYLDDAGANMDQGSASIYQYNGSNWVLMQKIIDATGAAGDYFGYDVSISGNYVIVGADDDDVGANTDQGSASIFQYNGTNWVLMNKITDATGATLDYFGASVSISGNYVIIGAYGDAVGANSVQGSAAIYQRVGLGWVKLQYVSDPSGNAFDNFGLTAAIDDTNKRFLIGVPGYAGGSGKVVFGKIN